MADEKTGFENLPIEIAPRELKGTVGKFMPVLIDGKMVPMRAEAVRERFQAGQRLQIATWDEYNQARLGKVSEGAGGALGAGALGLANGMLLNAGIPLTHAVLQAVNPETAKSFRQIVEAQHETHPAITLGSELAGAFTKLPGAIVSDVMGVGKGVVRSIAGDKAAAAMAEAATAQTAAQKAEQALTTAEGRVGAAARAGEREAIRDGLEMQRARAFVQGEEAGVGKALQGVRRAETEAQAAASAAPEVAAAQAEAAEAKIAAEAAAAPKAEAAVAAAAAPQTTAKVIAAAEAAAPKVAQAAAAAPEAAEVLSAAPKVAEAAPVAAPKAAATPDPWLEKMRAVDLEQQAAWMRKTRGAEAAAELESQAAAARKRYEELEAVAGVEPAVATPASSALKAVRAATEAQTAEAVAATAAPEAEAGATVSPDRWHELTYDEKGIITGNRGGGGFGAVPAAAAPEAAAAAVAPEVAAAAEPAVAAPAAAVPPAAAEPPIDLEAIRKNPQLFPENPPGLFSRQQLETTLKQVQRETLATEAEKLAAAQAKTEYELAKIRADETKALAEKMGTIPALVDPELATRAFIEGAGSRMTFDIVNDKENTIPGIVGDGVMAALAATGLHAGLSTMLKKYGSRAASEIAKDEAEFQKIKLSDDPKEQADFLRRMAEGAALRRVGLDRTAIIQSMNRFAGGPSFTAETLLHDLPKMAGKRSLGDFKNMAELSHWIDEGFRRSSAVIDGLLKEMDNPSLARKAGFSPMPVSRMTKELFRLEEEALAQRVGKATQEQPLLGAGEEAATAVRGQTVEFLRMQGALDENMLKALKEEWANMGAAERKAADWPDLPNSIDDLKNVTRYDPGEFRAMAEFINPGWENQVIHYQGLKNTALRASELSYRGDLNPILRGSKGVFAQVRAAFEETIERDMDQMFIGGGDKYLHAKRNWQAWKYITDSMQKKMVEQQTARIGGANVMSLLGKTVFTGVTAMYHPVTAMAAASAMIAPHAASLNMVQNAWINTLQRLSGGIHIDNKRLAMAAARESGLEKFLTSDTTKIPAGATKVVPTSDVLGAMQAVRAIAADPTKAQEAMQKTAEAVSAVSPELAVETMSRTQKALAALSASLPRVLGSDRWGEAPEHQVDPFALSRWQNILMGTVDPASTYDDLRMGHVPSEKAQAQADLYPEMTEGFPSALAFAQSKKTKKIHIPKVHGVHVAPVKTPKMHYEKSAPLKSLMPHASLGMDTDHFRGAQESYKQMEGGQQQQGGGVPGGGGGEPPSRLAAYQSPFGSATGLATGTQIQSRRA